MKNQIIKTPTKGKEYFGFTDTDIVVSGKKHDSMDSLLNSIGTKSILEPTTHIKIDNISQIKYNEKGALLTINHKLDNKEKKYGLSFGNANTRNEIAENISHIKGLTKSITSESKIKPLLINLFFVLIGLMLAVALTGIAYEASNGGEIQEFSGRRSGAKNLLAKIATSLGPIGAGIVGGLIVLYLIWRAIKRWQNPANEVIFS